MRDVAILTAVNAIRDLGDLPYTSNSGNSACKVVSEWSVSSNSIPYPLGYAAVKAIWFKNQSKLRKARNMGLIPKPKKTDSSISGNPFLIA